MLVVYTYKNCDACRRAVKWLAAQGLVYVEKPIRDTPPSPAELRVMLGILGGERRRLCNTSGVDYRAEKLGEQLATLAEADFLGRLAANGNLIKRPFLLRDFAPDSSPAALVGLVGFDPVAWEAALCA
ncbi:MAG: arsenate reductase family protein [Verrucomicrobia bacterium]|nr:arsenate reductase family protein [Verrucomicrobiota bacterium]